MTDAFFETALSADEAHRRLARQLASRGIADASCEARLLLLHALGLSRTELALARGDIGERGARALTDALARRLAGEPIARILGCWEFWSLTFELSPATLVPRPDTETLVERALAVFADRQSPLKVLDLGTGSGCILVALLTELRSAVGLGTDRSRDALAVARRNAVANGVGERALFAQGDWCAAMRGPFDLIVANPPYIARPVIAALDAEVREHDPVAALDGGPDGLDAYRAILREVADRPDMLARDGALLLEVGYDQAEAVRALGIAAGFVEASIARDLAGRDRVVTLRPPSSARSRA